MTRKFSLLALSLSLLLGSAACGGRAAKRGSDSPSAAPQVCRDYGDADSEAPASMESGADDNDYNSCYAPEPGGRDEINRLWNEIRSQRLASGLSAEPLSSETSRVHPMSVQEIREKTEHEDPKTQLCIDICKIEDSICRNADSICRLASELGNDDWATEKCDSGKASCEEATKKCADCVAAESLPPTE